MMYDRDGHDRGWGTWLGMGLMMTVLTILVVAAVVLVVRAHDRSAEDSQQPPARDSAGHAARQRGEAGAR